MSKMIHTQNTDACILWLKKSQELEAQVLKDENADISYNITLLNMQRLKVSL